MRGLVFILDILLLTPAFVLIAVAFMSALNAVELGGWRPTWSSPSGWFHPPSGVDAAGWRQWRRCILCLLGANACIKLNAFLFPFVM